MSKNDMDTATADKKTSNGNSDASVTDAAKADLKSAARPVVSTSDSPFSATIEKQIAEAKERLRLRRDSVDDPDDHASPFRKDGENGVDDKLGQAETEVFDVDPEPPVDDDKTSVDEDGPEARTVIAVGGSDSGDDTEESATAESDTSAKSDTEESVVETEEPEAADSEVADSEVAGPEVAEEETVEDDAPMAKVAAVTGALDAEQLAEVEAKAEPAVEPDVVEARSPALVPEVLVETDESELAALRQELDSRQRTGSDLDTVDDRRFGGLFPRRSRLQARKVRRVVRHVDPWSVLTFSVLFHLCVFGALLLASVLVWNAADAAGTIEDLEEFITDLGDYERFEIDGNVIFRAAVAVAGILTLASSVLLVLLTVVFNLISDLIGGIRITVIEEETVRIRRKPSVETEVRSSS